MDWNYKKLLVDENGDMLKKFEILKNIYMQFNVIYDFFFL